VDELKSYIREVPDFPVPGINFYDITTLLKSPAGLRRAADAFADLFAGAQVDAVAGIESRGFLFGPLLACRLAAGFVPIRKPGKLPAETAGHDYVLEYGRDRLEVHRDGVEPGSRVLIVDDLMATGGTAAAAGELVRGLGGAVVAYGFLIELTFLKGRDRLPGARVESVLSY
jgi:adenine phosphoribosyltransferase